MYEPVYEGKKPGVVIVTSQSCEPHLPVQPGLVRQHEPMTSDNNDNNNNNNRFIITVICPTKGKVYK